MSEGSRHRYGAFADDDVKADLGESSVGTHDLTGNEHGPPFAERV